MESTVVVVTGSSADPHPVFFHSGGLGAHCSPVAGMVLYWANLSPSVKRKKMDSAGPQSGSRSSCLVVIQPRTGLPIKDGPTVNPEGSSDPTGLSPSSPRLFLTPPSSPDNTPPVGEQVPLLQTCSTV
ncbi:unnamed protein product [Pleuronectes platessa]|uniref:Uncharacterized protein n=1 Tax=Pleuronectes platessa TaxID=8262 RepID=A0A9N7VGV9_PLEPL|nr:unnamed protein product [Pleuronectes platessa]